MSVTDGGDRGRVAVLVAPASPARLVALSRRFEGLSAAAEAAENERDEVRRERDRLEQELHRAAARQQVLDARLARAREEQANARRERDRTRKEMRAMASRTTTENAPSTPLRLALNKTDAADALGVSVDFFNDHVAREIRCVRRGRRRLYSVRELERWLDESSERASWGREP